MSIGIDDRRYHAEMIIARRIVLVVFVITVIFVGAARIGMLEADYDKAMVRYGSPPSQFMEIDATNLFWGAFLRGIYGDPGKVTEQLIERYRILNTLPRQEQRFRERLDVWRSSGGPDRDYATAGRVVAPTLIQWGASGPVLPAELFCEIAAAFTSTSPQVIQYSDLGHLLVIEDSVRTARDGLTFINTGAGGDACIAPENHPMENIR